MMNKFAALLIILFVFLLASTPAFAQSPIPISTASAGQTVKYDLAFPGMLPDNPLYKIKVLRDKIAIEFISDPKKKIDFYLHLADKGILAAAILIDKHNVPLAQTTALKAEHNMTLLKNVLYAFDESPSEMLIDELKIASLKHQEVLTSLLPRVSEDQQNVFQTVIDFSRRNLQSIEDFQYGKP